MNRRVPVQALRGADPTLLEAHLPDMLRRPLGQIALLNVMDLVELARTDGRPRALERSLQAFVDGLQRQVADIPIGRPWEQFLEDLGELSGRQVPVRFREMLHAEGSDNTERQPQRVATLLEKWAQEEPDPFVLGSKATRIQRAEMVVPKGPSPEPSAAPRERGERAERAPRGSSSPRAASPKTPKPVEDIERRDFVIDQALERLARTTDKGLAETVLVAGIRHSGREPYPDLTPLEITTVLKQLKDANRVRYSAGRWSLVTRF